MKKIYLLALCAVFLFNFSCKSDDDGGGSTGGELDGSLTVEEGKEQLEDNSIELLNKIDAFANNSELELIIELAEFLTGAESTTKSSSIFKKTLSNLSSESDVVVLSAKQSLTLISDTPLADDFNEEKGVYQWNADTEEFDKIGDSDDIIYNVAYNGKNAVFTVTDFTTILAGDDPEEVPTLAKANLKIDGQTVFSQDFSASFQNNQLIPSTINNTTRIGGFSFVTTYNNSNNTAVDQSFEFKIDSDVIMSYNYKANGSFNNEDGNIEDIVDNVDATFNFLDAALTIKAKDDNFNSDSELTVDEEVALLNNNVEAMLSIDNKLIAESEFYKDQDTYTDYTYNPDTDEFEEKEVTEDIVNARFVFEDGTSNDFDTYIEGSFTELEEKFEAVFEAYENLFADVDLGDDDEEVEVTVEEEN